MTKNEKQKNKQTKTNFNRKLAPSPYSNSMRKQADNLAYTKDYHLSIHPALIIGVYGVGPIHTSK